jgi:hypothetical protein
LNLLAKLLGFVRPAPKAQSELEVLTAPFAWAVEGNRAAGTYEGRAVEVWQTFEEIRVITYVTMAHRGDVSALAASLETESSLHRKTAMLLAATGQAHEPAFENHLAEVTLASPERVLCRVRYMHDADTFRGLLVALTKTCIALEQPLSCSGNEEKK